MRSKEVLPIILCGGSGTRLWPLSRESFPKQFLSLNFTEGKTLLQKTQIRISKLNNIKPPIMICNEDHRFIVAEQMREINIKASSIILEPFGRNTAPAIVVSALKSLEIYEDPYLLILSSDHQIENEEKFLKAVQKGLEYAEKNVLVTFGVVPNSPETGYGYIKSKETLNYTSLKASKIERFIEKPDKSSAERFIKDKRFTWNSGIFLFKANQIIKEINQFSPDIKEYCKKSLDRNLVDLDFQRLDKKYFCKCPNVSIDIAIMEKTQNAYVLPLNAGWSDIGSWEFVWKISTKNREGNVIQGNVITKDTLDSLLISNNRLITTIGVKDLIVIETSDAILVSNKNKSQQVKEIVQKLKEEKITEGVEHKKSFRPWGDYESIARDKRWQVKLINVKPGEKLSLQKHNYRSEHWIVVLGTAKVEIEEKTSILHENQSTYIPFGKKHRLSNAGEIDLKIIEIQCGTYLGEDDIERFEDSYGRIINHQERES